MGKSIESCVNVPNNVEKTEMYLSGSMSKIHVMICI